jgi:glycerol-3-phosphate dehydrogenase
MSFSWKDRQSAIDSVQGNPPELVVIGGGVVGCSTAAHAARFGLNVLLLEKEDLAAGASGNSTGLAHAGLRYLAQGRVGYVFHEGRERHRLQELAPQWVSPFNFLLPVYKEDPYKFWKVRLGTWIYDLLGCVDSWLTHRPLIRRHRVLSAAEVKGKIPGLRSDSLVGGIEYYVDARLQDSRFTLGYAQQAARYTARVATHCEVIAVDVSADSPLVRVVAKDLRTQKTFEFRTSLVVNASGAWIDLVRQMNELPGSVLQNSKGIHLVVDAIAPTPLIMSTATKGKVFFVLPIDAERSLVGTTDTPISLPPDAVRPDDKDVMELLQLLFHFFPYLKQGPNLLEAINSYKQVHVRDVYWGIRPLLRQGTSTLDASREHKLIKDLPRFWSMPGVKLTAGRAAGHETAVEAWRFLRQDTTLPAVTMDSLPGGELWDLDRFMNDAQKRFKLGAQSEDLMRYLVSMYGTRYVEVLQWAQREPRFSERVLPEEPWIYAQAAYSVNEEMVVTLNDFLWRRTKWAHYRDLPADVIEDLATIFGQVLNWSEVERQKQFEDYQTELKKHRLS